MDIYFRRCTHEDIGLLQDFSSKTFYETFADMNTPENMAAYLNDAFETEKLRSELLDTNVSFYFLYVNEKLAGYIKLNEGPAQTDVYDKQSLEIERIYVSKEFQGEGFGRYLMDKAISMAIQRKKEYIWLGVWERNIKALYFYKKYGFYEVITHSFIMGDDKQTDYILRKDLDKEKRVND